MKHAGQLDPGYLYYPVFGTLLVAVVVALLASGAMLHAVMASHRLGLRGLALNGAAGLAVLAIVVGAMLASGPPGWQEVLYAVLGLGVVWLFLAILASVLGSTCRPTVRAKPRA